MTTALANMIIEQQEAKKALEAERDDVQDWLKAALRHNSELLTLIEILRRDVVPEQYFHAAVLEAKETMDG